MDKLGGGGVVFIFLLLLVWNGQCEGRAYIIRCSPDMKPSSFASAKEWYSSVLSVVKGGETPIARVGGAKADLGILYEYRNVLNGFAAILTKSQAQMITKLPGVLAVLPDGLLNISTTRTPHFLGLDASKPSNIWRRSKYGGDVIVGFIDSGIWPEHPSFSDQGMSAIPKRWKGICKWGSEQRRCNRKIIGARVFSAGHEELFGPIKEGFEYNSPRDMNGHGTHVSSIAAGVFVANASYVGGYAAGVAVGTAPRSRIAVYKACWNDAGCAHSDIMAAFDAAIEDGVDILSVSIIGSGYPHYEDAIALGSFAAMERGILISVAGGNSGPEPSSIQNVAPWIFSVAASTIDRTSFAPITLDDGTTYPGYAILHHPNTTLNRKLFPIIYGADTALSPDDNYDASVCLAGSLDLKLVAGKAVICEEGLTRCSEKPDAVSNAGGAMTIIVNSEERGEEVRLCTFHSPATTIGFKAGNAIKQYIEKKRRKKKVAKATINFQGTKVGVKPAPAMASFSSRGPNSLLDEREILKPDITAPGVYILGAAPSLSTKDTRVLYELKSGTSMACPHISGLAALLKGIYPHWSPAAIRSALMTTASTVDNTGGTIREQVTPIVAQYGGPFATPFAYGSGHVVPMAAMNPGLVYDMGIQNYIDYLCGLKYSQDQLKIFTQGKYKCPKVRKPIGHFNYPSFSVVYRQTESATFSSTYRRTVLNVGTAKSTYKVRVVPPRGLKVVVEPRTLRFTKLNQKLSYKVKFSATRSKPKFGDFDDKFYFGSLAWEDGTHVVRSPVAFIRTT